VPLKPGLKLGPYEVLSRIGAGGMGEVYRARDTRLERVVALKVLHGHATADPQMRLRFEREARVIAALNHPHICTLFDIGRQDDLEYLVMEFLEGQTLEARLRGGPVPPGEAHGYARQLASALAAAHARGVVHRDIKPSNLFLLGDGLVKVLDFGIATEAMVPPDAETHQGTAEGVFVGTMAYAAPEQLRGEPVDERTDIFALGTVLYELLTGKAPFARKSAFDQMGAIMHEDPPALPSLVPLPLAFAITRCLAKRPSERFQSAQELLDQLDSTPAAAVRAAPTIAVLPFADLTPKRDQEYLCDGLADELITALMGLEGLRVASRTSAFQFKGRPENVAEIGRRLKVTNVLEGTVRTSGARWRITVRLTDVREGFQTWSARYDTALDDIFAVQDEIALAVVEQLKVTLRQSDAPLMVHGTANVAAYTLYLRGRHMLFKLTREGMTGGMQLLQEAVAAEPDFAEAHATLAYGHLLHSFSEAPPRSVMPKAKEAAERALALNPRLADGHLSLATVRHWFDWDWEGAEAAYREAIALSPGNAMARFNYAELLLTRGRFDEAIVEAARAIELDPVSPIVSRSMADVLYTSGRFEQARVHTERMLALEPTFFSTYWILGLSLIGLGQIDEAIAVFERGRPFAYGNTQLESYLGWAFALKGEQDRARKIARQLEARRATGYVSGGCIGLVYQGLGDIDEAMRWYRIAFDERAGECAVFSRTPYFAAAQQEARFRELIARVEAGAAEARV
jgi:TolB-like protein/Tfp pilus assembly protein PilF